MRILNTIGRDNVLFFLMGFIVFSPMSTSILMDYMHMPISMPELLIIPFLFLLKKDLLSIKITWNDIIFSGLICALLILFGLLYGRFSLYSMLSPTRSWFYIFIFYYAFKRYNSITNDHLLYISLGSIVSWMIISRLNFFSILENRLSDQGEMCTYGAMLIVPLFITLAMSTKKYLVLIFGLMVLLPTCIFSGVRRLMVVTLLSIIISFVLSLRKSKSGFAIYGLIGAGFIVLATIVLPVVMDIVESSSPEMYYRIFGRTLSFIESGDSESAGDASRMMNISKFFSNWFDYIIPRGMVSLHTSTDASIGLFNDFPLYQICWIFGIPVAFIFLLNFIKILIKNYMIYIRRQDETSAYCISSLLIMGCMLFLDGTFLGFAEFAPITGVLLGIASRNSKQL